MHNHVFSVIDDVISGPFTLFAPTDTAFQAVPSGTLSTITGTPPLLKSVLTYHVLNGFVLAPLLKDGESRPTLQGDDIHVTKAGAVSSCVMYLFNDSAEPYTVAVWENEILVQSWLCLMKLPADHMRNIVTVIA